MADQLAARLRACGHEVEVADARGCRLPPPQDYDAVILGSRVKHGMHARPIREYVREWGPELETIPTEFFSVGLLGGVDAQAWKLADLVTVALAEHPHCELSPSYGPI